MNVSRGDVALTRFPHASGGRGKKRPVVVVQAEAYNQRLRHAIVAEVTTNLIWDPANLTIDVSTDDGRATGLAQDSAVTCLHLATMLTLMIESGAHARQGKAITNFDRLLPGPQSDLAQQTAPKGRDSIAQGTALGGDCEFTPVALKGRNSIGRGRPHGTSLPFVAGIGFCLSSPRAGVAPRWGAHCRSPITQGSAALRPGLSNHAASRLRGHPTDSPTIGLILCQARNRVVAEYALRGMTQPIGVSEYELTRVLPRQLQSSLPSIDEIEAELTGPTSRQRPARRRPAKKKATRKAAK